MENLRFSTESEGSVIRTKQNKVVVYTYSKRKLIEHLPQQQT